MLKPEYKHRSHREYHKAPCSAKFNPSLDKDEWISQKISKLNDEGYEGDQAVAIAYDMWREKKKR